MIVDYETDIYKGISDIFIEKGFEIDTIKSRQKAIQEAQEKHYNIAILNIDSPDIGGINLLENLKQSNPNIDVIIVSRERDIHSFLLAFNKGVSACFLKPLDIDSLLDKMNNSIQKHMLIDEKRQAEQKLIESEEKYRQLVENIPDAIYSALPDEIGTISFMSNRWKDWTGYSPEDFYRDHETWLKSIHQEDRDETIKKFINAFKEKTEYTLEYRIVHKDTGKIRDLRDQGVPIFDEKGNISRFDGVVSDITENKDAERKLKESEEKFRTITEQSIFGIAILQDGQIKYINKSLAELAEYPINEIKSWSFNEFNQLIHPEDLPNIMQHMQEKLKKGKDITSQNIFRIFTRSGKIKWLEIISTTITYHGKLAILATLNDITEKKKIEQKLSDSEKKYRLITENVGDLIAVLNPKFEFEYINEKYHKILMGYTNEDALGKDFSVIVHPEDLQKAINGAKEILNKGEGQEELRIRHKDGNYVWLHVRGRVFIDDEGEKKISIISRDITKRKLNEIEIKRLDLKLKERIKELNFLYGISKVIENPDINIDEIIQETLELIRLTWQYPTITCARIIFDGREYKTFNFKETPYKLDLKVKINGKTLQIDVHYLENKKFLKEERDLMRDIGNRLKIFIKQKIVEEKLNESKEMFRILAEQSLFGIGILQDNIVKYVNQKMSDITGYSIQEMLHWNKEDLIDTFHPEDKNFVMDQMRKKQNGSKDYLENYQHQSIKKNGEIIWLEIFSNIINYDGKPADLVEILDITERKKLEQKLKESIESYKELETIVNTSPAVVFLWKNKEEWPVEYVSENIKQFGYTPEEFYSGELPYSEIIHHDDLDRVGAEVNLYSMEGVQEFEQEYRIITKSGEVCYIADHTWIRRNQKGVITHYQGIILNITNRKELEEKLKKSEEKYRLITENANDLIIVLKQNLECEYINEQISMKIWGYNKSDLMGKSVIKLIHRDDLEIPTNSLRKAFKKREGEAILRVKKKDGSYIWFEIRGKGFTDEKGERKVLLIARDITDRKKTEKVISDLAKFPSEDPNPVLRVTKEKVIYTNIQGENVLNIKVGSNVPAILQEYISEVLNTNTATITEVELNNHIYSFDITPIIEEGYANVYGRDITKRKQAEEKLKEAELRYRTTFEEAPDGIMIIDPETLRAIEFNDVMCNFLGYSREEFKHLRVPDYDANEDINATQAHVERIVREGKDDFETRMRTKTGTIKNVYVRIKTIELSGKTYFESICRDITARKKAEERMRLLSSAIEQSIEGIAVSDLKGNLLFANNAFANMHDYTPNELINKHLSIFHTPDQMPAVDAANQQIKDQGVFAGELWHTRRDGSVFPSLMHNSLFKDEMGNPIGMIGTLLDITEKKETEQKLMESKAILRVVNENLERIVVRRTKELKESEQKYKLILENLNDFVYILNENLQFEFINESVFKKVMGLTSKDLIGKFNTQTTHPGDIEKSINALKRVFKSGIGEECSYEVKDKDKHGFYHWLEVRGKTFLDQDGRMKVLLIARDITEKKAAEEKLKQSEEKYRLLIENAQEGIWAIDNKGYTTFANKRMAEILGYTDDEMFGEHLFTFMDEQGRKIAEKNLERRRRGIKEAFDFEFLKKDGTRVYTRMETSPIIDVNGDYIGAIACVADITDRKIAEQKLIEQKRFLSNVFTSIQDGLFIVDKNFTIISTNPKIEEWFSDKKPIIGKTCYNLLFNRDTPCEDCSCGIMSISKEAYHERTIELIDNKKESRIFNILNFPLLDQETGEVKGLIKYLRDITVQKKVEQKLKESEELFRTIFETAKDCMFIKDRSLRYIRINKAMEELFGVSAEDLLKKTDIELFGLEAGKHVLEIDQRVIQGEIIEEEPTKPINGIPHTFHTIKVPLKDSQGNIYGLCGFARDISDRKKFEQKLLESEEKYRSLIENAQEGVWAVDENDDTIFVNPKICEMLVYTKDEMMGKNLSLFLEDPMKELISSYRIHREKGLKDTYDLEFIKKDGTLISTSVKAAPILNENGEFKGSFAYITDITNRKIAEQKLKESEQRYRELFNNMSSGVALYEAVDNGQDFIFKDFNLAGEKIEHVKKEDLIGKNVVEMFPGVKDFGLFDVFQRVWRTGIPEHHPLSFYQDKRIQGWRENYVYKLPSGELVAVYKDITERKRAEQDLKESEERYRTLVTNISDVIIEVDWKGNFIYISPQCYDVFGFQPKEIIGKSTFKFVHPDDISIIADALKEVFKGKDFVSIEFRTKHKNGNYVIISGRGNLVNIGEEQKIIGVLRDITKKKEVERNLIESEEKYRNLYENSPNAILLLNMKGEIVDCNSITKKMFGFSKQELIGKNTLDHFTIPQEFIPTAMKNLKALRKGVIPEVNELKLFTKDKNSIWINSQVSLIKAKNENLIQVIIRDISSLKKAEELVKRELEKLREIDQIKNDLVQRIAHELRTPLTSIYSGSEFLLNYCRDKMDDKTQKFLNIINTGGYRLKELVDNLLLTFDIESDNLKLQLQNCDIIPIIEESIKIVAQMASKRKILIHKNLQNNLSLNIDNSKMKKVISNLIFNAVQNTLKNGSIYISTRKDLKYIEIIIEDTGVGFTRDEKKMIFKKFGKIERYGKGMDIDTEGPGLGLYIANKIIELHGGRIWVESEGRNKGSTFIIRIPFNK